MSNGSSTLGLPLSPSGSGLAAGGDRRKTIETCENIYLQAEECSKLRARTPPSNPHRVLLHRDKNDASIRTNGLGMRIIGGQECEDGSIGTYHHHHHRIIYLMVDFKKTFVLLFICLEKDVLSQVLFMVDQLTFKVILKLAIKSLNLMAIL